MGKYFKYLGIFLLLVSCLAISCQRKSVRQKNGPRVAGSSVKTFDFNGDRKIDSWVIHASSKDANVLGPIIERRTDLNFDGRIDITQYYQDELIQREEIDLDFDGVIDMRSTYESGVILKSELDLGFDGKTDLWRYYVDGKLVRKERDTNGGGQVDQWEYFEKDVLNRIGRDINGDGSIDVWDKQ